MSVLTINSLQALRELYAEKVLGWVKPPYSSIVGSAWVGPTGTVHFEGVPEIEAEVAIAALATKDIFVIFKTTQS